MSVYTDRLLQVCKKYQELTGLTESALSNKLFGGGSTLARVRQGRQRLQLPTYEAAIIWLNANWPAGHRSEWPKDVERLRFPLGTADSSG